jgi:hypothetical protein
MVPCKACLWFLRNLGSVPFKEGYLEVFGFLILRAALVDGPEPRSSGRKATALSIPVTMSFFTLQIN